MSFSFFAPQSKHTALALVAVGSLLLGACDSTVEGGGSGGAGGGESSSATGVAQGGSEPGTGGQQSSSVSAAGGGSPGGANAIALYGAQIPGGGGDHTVSVSAGVGAGGADPTSVAVSVGTGNPTGGSSGEGGYGSAVAVTSVGTGQGTGGDGGYGSAVAVTSVGTGGDGGYGSTVAVSSVGVGGSSGEGGYSSGVGGSDPGSDPDRLFLFISNQLQECADPYDFSEGCGARQFTAQIGLPPAYQQPGIYDLNDPAILSFFSQWEGDGDVCMGGGGSFLDGTIEVLAVTESIIQVRLAGTSPSDMNGVHDVLFCGAGPAPEESSVLAYFAGDVPPPEDTTVTTVGSGTSGGPEADSFVIDFADHGQLCEDRWYQEPGLGQTFEDFLIYLPPSYLTPGVYSLQDPAIGTRHASLSDNTGVSSGGFGIGTGTLTIYEVTPTYIDLALEGTQHDFANGAGQVPRCN